MRYKHLERHNIHAIPAGDFFDSPKEACLLVYSPLANKFFLALPERVDELEKKAAAGDSDATLDLLRSYTPLSERNPYGVGYDATATFYVILNEKCNFHCRYCYSAEGRSNQELSIGQIESSLRYFLSRERNAPTTRTVMFMGGGEPTLSWPLVEQATALAEKIADENGISLKMQLSTNGSILTSAMLEFYKSHGFELQFSFDVLPDVQDTQRGQFEKVSANLKTLGEQGIRCRIRSTVTELNVDRMTGMVEFCHAEYPQVRHLSCEPVVDPDYFTSPEIIRDFGRRYFRSFTQAQVLAGKYGMELFSTSEGTIRALRERFCFNLYCITPYGTMTTCPNISSPLEAGYENAIFGKVDQSGITFDQDAYNAITHGSIDTYDECKTCWARWNCGSGCPNQRRAYRPEIFDELCNHTRRMLRHSLIGELAEKHSAATGRDFFGSIRAMLENATR